MKIIEYTASWSWKRSSLEAISARLFHLLKLQKPHHLKDMIPIIFIKRILRKKSFWIKKNILKPKNFSFQIKTIHYLKRKYPFISKDQFWMKMIPLKKNVSYSLSHLGQYFYAFRALARFLHSGLQLRPWGSRTNAYAFRVSNVPTWYRSLSREMLWQAESEQS